VSDVRPRILDRLLKIGWIDELRTGAEALVTGSGRWWGS